MFFVVKAAFMQAIDFFSHQINTIIIRVNCISLKNEISMAENDFERVIFKVVFFVYMYYVVYANFNICYTSNVEHNVIKKYQSHLLSLIHLKKKQNTSNKINDLKSKMGCSS